MKICYLLPGIELAGGIKVILEHINFLNRLTNIKATAVAEHDCPGWFNQEVEFRRVDNLFIADLSEFDLIIATYYNQLEKIYTLYPHKTIHFCQGYEGDYPLLVDEQILAGRKPEQLIADIERAYSLPLPRFTVAPWLTKYLIDKFGNLTMTLGQAFDHKLFHPGRDQSYADGFRILIAGDSRLKFKGVKDALRAVSILRMDKPFIQIIRLNPYDNFECENSWACIDEYHCSLSPEMVAELYRTCHILVFIPCREGFGLPALEAMACGVPTVLSDIPPFKEISHNGETSLLVKPDIKEVADAVNRLLTEEALRDTLRTRGLMRAQDFHYHGLISKLDILLRFFSDYLKKYQSTKC